MLGRKEAPKPTVPGQSNGHASNPITLLTVVGETAKMRAGQQTAQR